ncbi:MAG: transketolase [Austwickia sp.]|nr:transketolase [Actinomycetota bacterium]MCB1253148.1 transketolase [Austwickia sp.]
MTITHEPQTDQDLGVRVKTVADAAYQIRMGVLEQGEAQGEGYVGQALGAADLFAAVYADQLRYRPAEPDWADRDRFLLSIGHYALGLYATLAEAGVIPREELATYASDGSRLPMSAMSSYTPGVEISGGSLGHGLGLGVGMALGLRQQGRTDQKVFVMFSDGELDEGSVWEAAMSANHFKLGNLIAVVDMNGLQADGRTADVLHNEPQEERWASFGWHTQRVDGNDVAAVLAAFDAAIEEAQAAGGTGRPHIIIADTRLGKGVPMLETREKLHFMKIAAEEWGPCKDQLTAGYAGKDV